MITISRRPETVQNVEFQIARSSNPDRPIMITINRMVGYLTTREARDLASVGSRIRYLLGKAQKSGSLDDRRIMAGEHAGAEFSIAVSSKDDTPGVDLQFAGRSARFEGDDIAGFCGVLAQIDTALNERRNAQPGGGVLQMQIIPDWGFSRDPGW